MERTFRKSEARNDEMSEQLDQVTPKILYVGRVNCEWTTKALLFLKSIGLRPTVLLSKNRGEKFPDKFIESWSGDLVISYRTHFILPQQIISKSKRGAINVHTGPPSFPGSGAVNWALYEGVNEFGITIHQMEAKVDSGEILGFYPFKVYSFDNFSTLSERANSQSYLAFCDFFANYFDVNNPYQVPGIELTWTRVAKKIRELDELESIQLPISKAQLEKVIRATSTDKRAPYIDLYGFVFKLVN